MKCTYMLKIANKALLYLESNIIHICIFYTYVHIIIFPVLYMCTIIIS